MSTLPDTRALTEPILTHLTKTSNDTRPVVVMTCGIAGAGKSTLAIAIVSRLPNFTRLSNDQFIYESHGLYNIDYPADKYFVYQDEASRQLIAKLESLLKEKNAT
ncbi:hypothetical protein DER45DRAFT_551763 [Fusarium avenaceum]|nr:hypothetical protein DER45DRAFT_551763 [Fusarium avenaceum]